MGFIEIRDVLTGSGKDQENWKKRSTFFLEKNMLIIIWLYIYYIYYVYYIDNFTT